MISLKTALQQYISFRQEVIVRRSRFELRHAKERAHILEGLKIALDHMDEVIGVIRHSPSAEAARGNLMASFNLTQAQAQAILDMQLRRLAALEREKLIEEYTEVLKAIAYLEDLLANPRKILFLVKQDTVELKTKYGDPRRTEIVEEEPEEFREEDLIHHQKVMIVLTTRGYIKRMPIESYRVQQRGGRGVMGIATREAESVRLLLVADTLDTLLFFTNRGRVYSLKCYRVPLETSRTAKGIPMVKLISVGETEQVTEILAVSSFVTGVSMIMATRRGVIKRSALKGFAAVRANGLIAMRLGKVDELVAARVASQDDEIILVTEGAQAIRFAIRGLRTASRTSGGVRAIHVASDDRVVAMDIVSPNAYLMVITKNGLGKCTPLSSYRLQARGGTGIKSLSLKVGKVVAARVINTFDEVMILSAQGVILRMRADNIPIQGRIRRGASLMKPDEGDEVISIAALR
ncbi:DNA gyrase subunit A [subsurface metagenome]